MENAGRAVADAVAPACSRGARRGRGRRRPGQQRRRRLRLRARPGGTRLSGPAAAARRSRPAQGRCGRGGRGAGRARSRRRRPRRSRAPDVIVDALFGAGLDRPVEGAGAGDDRGDQRARACRSIAVDLPSGINGTSGAVMGAAVQASETVTFFRRKPGHLLLPGRLHCGPVEVADIGIPDDVLDAHPAADLRQRAGALGGALSGAAARRPQIRARPCRGRVRAISRTPARRGWRRAARCGPAPGSSPSPRRAMRSPSTPPQASPSWSGRSTARRSLRAFLADPRLNAVVLGPGGGVGPQMRDMVLAALVGRTGGRARRRRADQLCRGARSAVRGDQRRAAPSPTVLTPHEGEFARLFRRLPKLLKSRRNVDRARPRPRPPAPIVLLKGPDTVVAAPDGPRRDRRQCAALARDRRLGRRAGRASSPGLLAQGMPALRGGERRRLAARRGRQRGRAGPDRRGPARGAPRGLPAALCRSWRLAVNAGARPIFVVLARKP